MSLVFVVFRGVFMWGGGGGGERERERERPQQSEEEVGLCLIMEAEEFSKTLYTNFIFTGLMAQEYFIAIR